MVSLSLRTTPTPSAMQAIHTYSSPYPQPLTPNMATMGLSNTNNLPDDPARRHRRKNSGELDVFDATQYYSGGMDRVSYDTAAGSDMMNLQLLTYPSTDHSRSISTSLSQKIDQRLESSKKWKQQSSPGARLASFFTSLFHQTVSKRKPKPKLTTTTTTTTTLASSNSMHSNTPKAATFRSNQSEVWGGDKFIDGFVEKKWVLNRSKDWYLRKDSIWGFDKSSREVEVDYDDDDDCGSECSSDLFELKSFDLGGLRLK